MNRSVFSLGLYVFQNNLSHSFCKPFQVLKSISDLQYKQVQQDTWVTFYASQISTWMRVHLRNRFAVQICTTLILKLLHGYSGRLPQNSPPPATFRKKRLSARALPARERVKNRNTIQPRYLRKSLWRVSNKGVGGVSPDGGISMEKAVKWSGEKKSTMTCLNFRMHPR